MKGEEFWDTIPSGFDFLQTAPAGAIFHFDALPIPPGFFSARSEEFAEKVKFIGGAFSGGLFADESVTHVDTIVQRKSPARLAPPYPSSTDVPIEMVGLALRSLGPIGVRVGNRIESWDVFVQLSQARASTGVMKISKVDAEGGVFDSEFSVFPVFRFVRQCDGREQLLDVGELSLPPEYLDKLIMRTRSTPWLHEAVDTLRIEGLNDRFVAGAPALFVEEGQACSHAVSEAPGCSVSIDIASSSRCLCRGSTRQYTAVGSPANGMFSWSIASGLSRATIVSGAQQSTVTVRGEATSSSVDDITLKVEYLPPSGGTSCSASVQLTTIEATLEFRASGTWDPQNSVVRQVPYGGDQLGAVEPGMPQGTEGFFKKIEIRATIKPKDPALPCVFRFRQDMQGRSGTLLPNGFHPDAKDCPAPQRCSDHPDNILAQDLTLSPDGTIFCVDAPGLGLPGGVLACDTPGQVFLACFNFRTWLEADQQKCTTELNWHAYTRIRCSGATLVLDNTGNGNRVGLGWQPECIMGFAAPFDSLSLPKAIGLLDSDSPGDRLRGQSLVTLTNSAHLLGAEDRPLLVRELMRIASDDKGRRGFYSRRMVAIELLGELRATEAVGLFMEDLMTAYPRTAVRFRDHDPATVSSDALAQLGELAVGAIIDRAESTGDDEWIVLEHTLRRMEDQSVVRKAICAALDLAPGDACETRLDRLLGDPSIASK